MVGAKLTFEILSRNSNRITQRRITALAGTLRRHRRPPATASRPRPAGHRPARPPGATGHPVTRLAPPATGSGRLPAPAGRAPPAGHRPRKRLPAA